MPRSRRRTHRHSDSGSGSDGSSGRRRVRRKRRSTVGGGSSRRTTTRERKRRTVGGIGHGHGFKAGGRRTKYGMLKHLPPQGPYKTEMENIDRAMQECESKMTMLLWTLPGIDGLMNDEQRRDWDNLRIRWECKQAQRIQYTPPKAMINHKNHTINGLIGNIDIDDDGEITRDEVEQYFLIHCPDPIVDIALRAFDSVDNGRALHGDDMFQFAVNYAALVLDTFQLRYESEEGSGSARGGDESYGYDSYSIPLR